MKDFKYIAMAALMAIGPNVIYGEVPPAPPVHVPVDHVYIPAGFDSNDNAEVVITGYLPNLCYKSPNANVEIDKNKISVNIKALKARSGLGFCAQVIVPYIETINLGVLDRGKYLVAVNENSGWEKKSELGISEATSNSIDDVVYANVEEVVKSEEGRKVLLKGYNTSDCFQLKEIAIKDNGSDTYSVLPVMKQVSNFCPRKMIPFSYEFEVPEKLKADRVLLHVRVMNGKSLNALFNNRPLED